MKVIKVGNGESVNIPVIISLIITIQGHMFEIKTMLSKIHNNVDLVLGIKNFVELEGEIRMKGLTFKFLNKAVPIFLYTKK